MKPMLPLNAQETLDLYWADRLLDRAVLAVAYDDNDEPQSRLDREEFVRELTNYGREPNLASNLASAGRGLVLMQLLDWDAMDIARTADIAGFSAVGYRITGEPPYHKEPCGPFLPQPRGDSYIVVGEPAYIVVYRSVKDEQDPQYLRERAARDPAFAMTLALEDAP